MQCVKIERNPYSSRRIDKYKKIIDDILLTGERKISVEKKPVKEFRRDRWKFKSCPKCKTGDMNSSYGDDFVCFQCGYIEYSWNRNIKGGYNGKT